MRTHETHQGRSPAFGRLIGAALALLLLFGGLVQVQDSIRVHARCPEHGEEIHLDSNASDQIALAAHDAVNAANSEVDGEHCHVWSVAESRANVQPERAHCGDVQFSTLATPGDACAVTRSLHQLAPKTSPPTVA